MNGNWLVRKTFCSIRSSAPLCRSPYSSRNLFRRFCQSGKGNGNGNNGTGGKKTQFDGNKNWPLALWTAYLAQLEKKPLFTKMWTSGLLNAVGDLLAQNFIEKKNPIDRKRLLVFVGLGVFMVGPALHYWYSILARMFSVPGAKTAIGSLLFDQVAFAPCFCAAILSTLVIIETQNPSLVRPKLEQDWVPAVIMNWKIWVPSQLVNFWIIPPPLRVLFANIVAVVWNTYLSYAAHKKFPQHK